MKINDLGQTQNIWHSGPKRTVAKCREQTHTPMNLADGPRYLYRIKQTSLASLVSNHSHHSHVYTLQPCKPDDSCKLMTLLEMTGPPLDESNFPQGHCTVLCIFNVFLCSHQYDHYVTQAQFAARFGSKQYYIMQLYITFPGASIPHESNIFKFR